jgi:hypothetical protein
MRGLHGLQLFPCLFVADLSLLADRMVLILNCIYREANSNSARRCTIYVIFLCYLFYLLFRVQIYVHFMRNTGKLILNFSIHNARAGYCNGNALRFHSDGFRFESRLRDGRNYPKKIFRELLSACRGTLHCT